MRIVVVGVGLIGGSVALAARNRLGAHVVGCDPSAAVLADALQRGVIDEAITSLDDLHDEEFVFVAAPVDALLGEVREAVAQAHPDAVVTDVGSVKAALCAEVTDPRFVGGHPLAGAETGGVAHAREDLFDGATWYLTPTEQTSGIAYERLHRLLRDIGARPTAIIPADHDRLMATISHLPHIVANLLVQQASTALGDEVLPPVGPSFRDMTRVAGANPELWGQIYAANADALSRQIDTTVEQLRDVQARLRDLAGWQAQVQQQRAALIGAADADGPVLELRVAVPNQPGVVAELALTLGRAGINISDMSLAPSADHVTGVVGLWVAEDDLERARELIAQKGLAVS